MKSGEDIDTSAEFGQIVPSEQLSKLLSTYSSGVDYKPIQDEPDPLSLFPELSTKIVYTIQPIPSSIPAEEVGKVIKITHSPAFIFVPGRAFDASGTRHGKGAGWYDRFLSIAPKELLRIGFCYEDQFSKVPLLRQSWDEPMDFVCVVHKDSGILTTWKNQRLVL